VAHITNSIDVLTKSTLGRDLVEVQQNRTYECGKDSTESVQSKALGENCEK